MVVVKGGGGKSTMQGTQFYHNVTLFPHCYQKVFFLRVALTHRYNFIKKEESCQFVTDLMIFTLGVRQKTKLKCVDSGVA